MHKFFRTVLLLPLLTVLSAGPILAEPQAALTPVAGTSFDLKLTDSPKELVDEVWQTVNREYVDPSFNKQDWLAMRQKLLSKEYRTRKEAYAEIRKALKVLGDPYTRFLDPREFQALRDQTSGELVGVGIQLGTSPTSKLPIIQRTIANSPAFQAGLKAKDELVAVDGKATKTLEIAEVSRMIRGDRGTRVTLSVLRDGRRLDFTITRAPIELPAVTAELKSEQGQTLGYIRLAEFSDRAPAEVKKAITDLEGRGARGLVLDLRGNPGGLLDAAARIASLLLPEGTIISTVNRQGQREPLPVTRAPLTTLPMVVLVDGGSASASEILAAALQENGRAQLVGTKTFGKGVIQQVNPLSDGSGVNVTIAHYLTPKGNDIHKKGIVPDIVAEFPTARLKDFTADDLATAKDVQYQRAVAVLGKQLPGGTVQ